MKVRYRGPEEAIDLALPGACLTFPRLKWLDPAKLADEAGVPAHHLDVILGALGDDWETDDDKKTTAKSATPSADEQENAR